MESTAPRDPAELDAALSAADQVRGRLVGQMHLPPGHHAALAAAVAIQVGCAAVGIARQTVAGLVVVGAGLLVFAALATLVLRRFRRANGAVVGGLASRAVLGTDALSSLVYAAALAVATWAAFEEAWWLVGLAAVAGGVGYAAAAHRWWTAYRRDPSTHARGDSPLALAALVLLACLGAVLLLVIG